MLDGFARSITYLRISITDRCNYRCRYCMPDGGIEKCAHEDICSLEGLRDMAAAAVRCGVKKIRVTGGEPLVRRGAVDFCRMLSSIAGVEELCVTTNGSLLKEVAQPLRDAGVTHLNISLDTLKAASFTELTRRPFFVRVEDGIEAIAATGLRDVKFNCVPIAGVNEAELPELVARFTRERPWKFRFIELMPIGCAYEAGLRGLPMAEVRSSLEAVFGPLRPVLPERGVHGPAVYYQAAGFAGQIGFIDAMEHQFCSSCNRVRLTAEGFLKLCLNARTGMDLRGLLRSGMSDDGFRHALQQAIYHKPQEHYFKAASYDEKDSRAMYQVGG